MFERFRKGLCTDGNPIDYFHLWKFPGENSRDFGYWNLYTEHRKIGNRCGSYVVGVEERHVCEIHPPVRSRTLISFAVSLGRLLREISRLKRSFSSRCVDDKLAIYSPKTRGPSSHNSGEVYFSLSGVVAAITRRNTADEWPSARSSRSQHVIVVFFPFPSLFRERLERISLPVYFWPIKCYSRSLCIGVAASVTFCLSSGYYPINRSAVCSIFARPPSVSWMRFLLISVCGIRAQMEGSMEERRKY